MHPENLQALKEADIDYVSLANNHTMDYQHKGMVETMTSLRGKGIQFSGVGNNLSEAMKPAYFQRHGVHFACYRSVVATLFTYAVFLIILQCGQQHQQSLESITLMWITSPKKGSCS